MEIIAKKILYAREIVIGIQLMKNVYVNKDFIGVDRIVYRFLNVQVSNILILHWANVYVYRPQNGMERIV